MRLTGVSEVVAGYTGGHIKNPAYREVCTGRTGHAECVQITFDPSQISFQTLLEIFFDTHDPTTLNRQGNDVGTQYRSGVYYHSEEQKDVTEAYISDLEQQNTFANPIVTEISAFEVFYAAEIEHKDYYNIKKNQPY